jgi:hypothetical protein
MHLRCGIRVSTGSSMVMMWPERWLVDLVQHRGDGGRLALAGVADDQHQAAGHAREFLLVRMQAQLGQRQRLLREAADHAAQALLALEAEAVGADARRVQVDRAVEGALGDALAPVRLDDVEELFQLFLRDRRIRHRHQALRLAQHQRTVLVNDDVRKHQLRVQQVQDLLDQGAEHRMVFIFDIRQGGDLRGLVVFHRVGR